ncbi:MAG: VCBS repeat-containing protein [Candidatus Competibacterales bacterium]|nr:VCBS repeat-containing protein [Candidatus Competibacterales bacterium]
MNRNPWRQWLILACILLPGAFWRMSPAGDAPIDRLPHSRTGAGQHDIVRAWLVAPTDRYAHGVLGDRLEAAGLEVQLRDGQHLRRELDSDVFEDLLPRVQDLDGDGRDEIILVRSNARLGARLSVWGVRGGLLVELARGPAIGQGRRWLNPVGAADLDGDGRTEIAYVQTPHIGGVLRILEYREGPMPEEYRAEGFSNHRIGSTDLSGLHAIDDHDGDGRPDLRIRDTSGRHDRFLRVRFGRLEQWRGPD